MLENVGFSGKLVGYEHLHLHTPTHTQIIILTYSHNAQCPYQQLPITPSSLSFYLPLSLLHFCISSPYPPSLRPSLPLWLCVVWRHCKSPTHTWCHPTRCSVLLIHSISYHVRLTGSRPFMPLYFLKEVLMNFFHWHKKTTSNHFGNKC